MLREKSETEDKAQGGALGCSADSQVKRVEFSCGTKSTNGSKEDLRILQFLMEMSRRQLNRNLDC